MKTRDAVNAGVILAVASSMLAAVAMSQRHGASATAVERERCYGVSRAGANDCANAVHSCAGQSTTGSDLREWVYVAKGTCTRLAGGRLNEHTP